jgi:MFS family permease
MIHRLFADIGSDNRRIFLALLLWGIGEGMWFFIQPLYLASLGANPVEIGTVLSIAAIITTVVFIPAGWLADRTSRRRNMIVSWFTGIAGGVLLAIAPDWRAALPGLIVYGLSSFGVPAMSAYVTHASDSRMLQRTFTLVFAGFPLGTVVGPTVGGWIGQVVGIRWVYVLSVSLFILSTLVILGIREQPGSPVGRGEALTLGRDHRFLAVSGFFFLAFLAGAIGQPLAPNYLEQVRGLNVAVIGVLGSFHALGNTVLTIGLGRWRHGHRWLIMAAQACLVASYGLLLSSEEYTILGLAFFLRGSFGALRAVGAAYLGTIMPPASMALGFGIYQTMLNLALTIAPYLAGLLYSLQPDAPFWASLAFLPFTLLATAWVVQPGTTPTPHSDRVIVTDQTGY